MQNCIQPRGLGNGGLFGVGPRGLEVVCIGEEVVEVGGVTDGAGLDLVEVREQACLCINVVGLEGHGGRLEIQEDARVSSPLTGHAV